MRQLVSSCGSPDYLWFRGLRGNSHLLVDHSYEWYRDMKGNFHSLWLNFHSYGWSGYVKAWEETFIFWWFGTRVFCGLEVWGASFIFSCISLSEVWYRSLWGNLHLLVAYYLSGCYKFALSFLRCRNLENDGRRTINSSAKCGFWGPLGLESFTLTWRPANQKS